MTIATPPAALAVYQSAEPGNLVTVCEDGDAFGRLLEDDRRNAILVGPGSGIGERTRTAALAALATRRPVVLDADAITVFGQSAPELFAAIQGPALLTPHEGEFRRLFPDLTGTSAKVERARRAAHRSGATVLLKGPDTVIAAPDGRASSTFTPRLASPRQGRGTSCRHRRRADGTGLSAFSAAAAAAWLHGECALRFARPGLIAEDLVGQIPEALQAAAAAN